jgi:hypothetical protein
MRCSDQDAQRSRKAIIFPNQNIIEAPAAGTVHQCSVCAVVLALGPASSQGAATNILLISGEAAPGRVFAQGEQLRLRVLFTGGDARRSRPGSAWSHNGPVFTAKLCSLPFCEQANEPEQMSCFRGLPTNPLGLRELPGPCVQWAGKRIDGGRHHLFYRVFGSPASQRRAVSTGRRGRRGGCVT